MIWIEWKILILILLIEMDQISKFRNESIMKLGLSFFYIKMLIIL